MRTSAMSASSRRRVALATVLAHLPVAFDALFAQDAEAFAAPLALFIVAFDAPLAQEAEAFAAPLTLFIVAFDAPPTHVAARDEWWPVCFAAMRAPRAAWRAARPACVRVPFAIAPEASLVAFTARPACVRVLFAITPEMSLVAWRCFVAFQRAPRGRDASDIAGGPLKTPPATAETRITAK